MTTRWPKPASTPFPRACGFSILEISPAPVSNDQSKIRNPQSKIGMGLLEQQNFLARIFTDEGLRLSFWENPVQIGSENGLDETDLDQLKKIVEADLNFFAKSLFQKRLHEVEKLLPLTKKALGSEFADLFREFAHRFQPSEIRKHLQDAIVFCRYLQSAPAISPVVRDVSKFELTKHLFFKEEKLFSFCFVRHDVFSLSRKLGGAVWCRIGKNTRHFIL